MTARDDDFRPRPGFQGSETSGAEVTFYSHNINPIQFVENPIVLDGQRRSDKNPSLFGVDVNKQLGAAAGTFTILIKPGRLDVGENFFHQILDDDWVDIVLYRHRRKYHVMRGLVNSVRKTTVVSGTGATSEAYAITGQDFAKVWEKTPVWFNPQAGENVGGGIAYRVFSSNIATIDPDSLVLNFLRDFLREIEDLGRANWVLPPTMPRLAGSELSQNPEAFINNLIFNFEEFLSRDPEVTTFTQNFLMPTGTLWQLAKEWSDPMFNELFVDVYPNAEFSKLTQGRESRIDESGMAVTFRQKPFPTLEKGKDSPWFSLPLFVVPREAIVNNDTGKSGDERYNAFFVAPQLLQEALGSAIDIVQPLWFPFDISQHGLRRFDVMTKYATANAADLGPTSSRLRERVRDWYVLNPYFLNGTLSLALGMPDIKIGTRVRVPGARTELDDETYYVEGVSHAWRYGTGTRTNLTVTRGWQGTDDTLLDRMKILADQFTIPPLAQPKRS